MATLLTNCSVVDGVSATARTDTSVLVDDGRIRAVGPAAELRGTADEIDLHAEVLLQAALAAAATAVWRDSPSSIPRPWKPSGR